MTKDHRLSRRSLLSTVGAVGATAFLGNGTGSDAVALAAEPPKQTTDLREHIFSKVWATPLIDTHEHLCDEHERFRPDGDFLGADDWTVILSGYLGSDLLSAGMPGDVHRLPPRTS